MEEMIVLSLELIADSCRLRGLEFSSVRYGTEVLVKFGDETTVINFDAPGVHALMTSIFNLMDVM